jgi:serine protease Do
MLDEAYDSYVLTIGRKQVQAKVIAKDTVTDVAVLKVEGTGWQPIKVADVSKVRTGQHILLVGSAFAGTTTAADGIVSSRGRQGIGAAPYLAISVPIHPGNGGAPIFNLQGEAVGMVAVLFTGPKDSKFSNLGKH